MNTTHHPPSDFGLGRSSRRHRRAGLAGFVGDLCDGKAVYDKELAVDDRWESSFVAAIAVPAAFNHHSALVQKLAGKLLDDPAFRAAVRR